MDEYNEVRLGKFMNEEVRIVDYGYHKRFMVVKDMFNALGRLTGNNDIAPKDIKKFKELKEDLEFEEDKDYKNKVLIHTKICDTPKGYGSSKARNTQQVNLINIERVPILLTQFKPRNGVNNYEDKLKIWRNFMKFVDKILQDYHMEDYIIDDKEQWKSDTKLLGEDEEIAKIANRMVNINMAKLLGIYDQGIKQIRKPELKLYQDKVAMDLLAVRQEVYKDFIDAYLMFGSKRLAMIGSLNKAIKKYKLDIELEKLEM